MFIRELYKGSMPLEVALKKYGMDVIDKATKKGWVRIKDEECELTDYGKKFLEDKILAPQEMASAVGEEIKDIFGDDVEVDLEVNWKEDKEGNKIPLGTLKVLFKNPEHIDEFAAMQMEFWRKLPRGFKLKVMHDSYIRINSYWKFSMVDSGYFELPGLVVSIEPITIQTELGRVRRMRIMEIDDLCENNGREPMRIDCIVDENTDKVQVGEKVIIRGRKETSVAVAGSRPLRDVLVAEEVKRVDEIRDWIENNKELYEQVKKMLLNLIYENGFIDERKIRWVERRVTVLGEERTYLVPAIIERLANLINYGVAFPKPILYILSLLLVPESGMSVLIIGDKGTGKNTAARTLARLLELGGKRHHVYRCERTSVANVFGGVVESGAKSLLRGSILLYDFVVFDEFHGAQRTLRAKMREYMGEHTVTIDLLSGNKALQSLKYPAWQPCLILSNDKNGDNVEKIKLVGEKPVPVPLQEVIDRIESGPFIDRLTYYLLITEGDAYFWRDEIARRQERYKIVYKNGEKIMTIKFPNERALEGFMKTLMYEISKTNPVIPDDVEKYLSSIADRRQRDAIKLASLAIAKLCLSPAVTKEMVDFAYFLRWWSERTLMRQYYFYIDMEGNILEMNDEARRDIEERYLSQTLQTREARLRELETTYVSWLEQNAKLPSKTDMARILGVSPAYAENLLSLLYPDVVGVRVKRSVRYVLLREEVFRRFPHLFEDVSVKDLKRLRDLYIKVHKEEPKFPVLGQTSLTERYVRVRCKNCDYEWKVEEDVVPETLKCPACGYRGAIKVEEGEKT